jgi:hypothetical protein
MPRHSARRFLFEVLFLAGVAAALTYAELRPAAIIGVEAVAWAVVALLEWTAWLDEPHYGRGLPPRYYVPHVALPPPVAVDQVEPYPVLPPVEDEPTFVASTQEWGLADWPALEATAVAEDTVAVPPASLLDDEGVPVVRLPPPIPDVEETVAADVLAPEETEDEPLPIAGVVEAAVVAPAVAEPGPTSTPELLPVRGPEPARVLAVPARVTGTAFHRVDPLTASRRRRLFSRGGGEETPQVEVLDGPPPDRTLPSRVLEQLGRR